MKSLPHLSLLVCVLLLQTLHAQTPNRIYRQYATQEVMTRLEKENLETAAKYSSTNGFFSFDSDDSFKGKSSLLVSI
jgi:hypothetical protein